MGLVLVCASALTMIMMISLTQMMILVLIQPRTLIEAVSYTDPVSDFVFGLDVDKLCLWFLCLFKLPPLNSLLFTIMPSSVTLVIILILLQTRTLIKVLSFIPA